ncbi:MAG: YraN family protein [Acidobacteria bacterium]|nr:YraN family protein [Acidobacteriota bacterium]
MDTRTAARPFAQGDSTHRRGRQAEAAGRRWLEERGYRILATNYRTPLGEIDLVAREQDTVCFIEIKARVSPAHGPAIGAVTARQRARVARAAALYLQATGYEGPCRFDVLGLDWDGEDWLFELVQEAFEAP